MLFSESFVQDNDDSAVVSMGAFCNVIVLHEDPEKITPVQSLVTYFLHFCNSAALVTCAFRFCTSTILSCLWPLRSNGVAYMSSRLREFREVSQASTSRNAGASVEKQEHVDALRRRKKRRLARALALQQQPDSSTSAIDVNDPDIDVWTLEATRIAGTVASLGVFLSSIRRAYLDLSSSASSSGGSHAYKGKGASDKNRGNLDLSKGAFEAWKDVKWLNGRERDEVDWQAKTTLKKCMSRVRQLEQAESSEQSCCKYPLVVTDPVYFSSKLFKTGMLRQHMLYRYYPQITYPVFWAYYRILAVHKLKQKSNYMLIVNRSSYIYLDD